MVLERPDSDRINRLTQTVVACAAEVHRHLGPGLVRPAYLRALFLELGGAAAPFEADVPVPIAYKGEPLPCSQTVDLVVGGAVLVLVHTVTTLLPSHTAQAHSLMRLLPAPVGLLLNFDAPVLKNGIRRLVAQEGLLRAS